MGIAELAIAFHIIAGMCIGSIFQEWHDERKYVACVYNEKKQELKEMKDKHYEQIKECN
jgi:Na+/glutamate symporter